MKLHITGNAGSGKTTLAKQLGQALNIPVDSLDRIVWKEGWVSASKVERALGEQNLIEQSQWIIEGVSKKVRDHADYIIFLDLPRHICILRCLRRNLSYLFCSRPELPVNCPEIRIIPRLLKLIWRFPQLTKPSILQSIVHQQGIVISETVNIDDLVANIKANLHRASEQ